jgi:hypothetical protein
VNERILELAEQANELDYETFDEYNHKTVKHYKFNKEKFAELIVKECIWALWTEECRTSDLASEEYTRGSNKINDHFWG